MDTSLIFRHFRELEKIDDDIGKKILTTAQLITIPESTVVFRPNEPCKQYLLACEGSIKVQQMSEDGREIVLYRVQNGESCVLTTTCLLSREDYSATGITETDVKALTIPAQRFHEGLNGSAALRQFVFNHYNQRLSELIQLVRSLAFDPLENRLARSLLKLADQKQEVHRTHQSLATDLGCTREVISRRLKEFEHLGWVRLHRGHIEIANCKALETIATQ